MTSVRLDQATRALMQSGTGAANWRAGAGALTTPAPTEDGVVYSDRDRVSLLSPQGEEIWAQKLDGKLSSPGVHTNGNVFVLNTSHLTAFDKTGQMLWQKPVATCEYHEPAVGPEGNVYCVDREGKLRAFDQTGKELWSKSVRKLLDFDPTPNTFNSPVVCPNGNVLVANTKKYLTAFTPRGSRAWTYKLPGELMTGPSVGRDGSIALGAHLNTVVKLNARGKEIWQTPIGSSIICCIPAIGLDGAVLAGTSTGLMARISPEGEASHVAVLSSKATGQPLVADDGSFTVAGWLGHLSHFGPEGGRPRWTAELGGVVLTSPRQAKDGTIYASAFNGGLMALREHCAPATQVDLHLPQEPERNGIAQVDGWLMVGGTRVKVKS